MYVKSGSTVDVFGTLFSGNTAAGSGDDIYRSSGTVTIHSTCPAGYEGSSAAQGGALDTDGDAVSGPLFSFSGCTVCPAGGYSASPGSDCVACPAGTTLADEAKNHLLHDAVEDCANFCPAGMCIASEGATSAAECIEVCPAGTYSNGISSGQRVCPAGTYLEDDATSNALHDSVEDCDVCPAGT
jgi:hypothetical protein